MIGVPLTAICNARYTDPRQRQLFKNIVYVGALSALLDIDAEVIETLFGEQYKGKEQAARSPTSRRCSSGATTRSEHFDGRSACKVRRADAVGDRIFVEGNAAAALGCVYGGATVCAWYPITPSSVARRGVPEVLRQAARRPGDRQQQVTPSSRPRTRSPRSAWCRRRLERRARLHRTSGPGISLMTEFIGLAYFAEIPAVIFDVQRGGPSTGMPTRTQQADLLGCAYASHGDTKHVLLFPEDPRECFDFGAQRASTSPTACRRRSSS